MPQAKKQCSSREGNVCYEKSCWCAMLDCDVRQNCVAERSIPKRVDRGAVQRRGVLVCGVVQGVGFRPFVYRLASEEARVVIGAVYEVFCRKQRKR